MDSSFVSFVVFADVCDVNETLDVAHRTHSSLCDIHSRTWTTYFDTEPATLKRTCTNSVNK